MADLAAGALRLGRGGRGVAVRGLAGLLQRLGTLFLLVGHALAVLRGRVQRAHQVTGGLGACGKRGGGVPLGLADRRGDARGAVARGAVAQYRFGRLPRGVEGAGVGQLTSLCRGTLFGDGQGQRSVPVGQFRGDQRTAAARLLRLGHRVGGGGDLLREVGGQAPFVPGAGGHPARECAGAALGAPVDVAGTGTGLGGLDNAAEQVDRSGREVPLGGELGAAAQLVAETADQVGQSVGVTGVGDGAQQQVGEVGVLLDREEACRLALVGVHLPLVAEQFGVEADVAEVLVPAVVDLLPVHVEVRIDLAGLGDGVAEALHGAAPALRPGGAFDARPYGGGLGDRQ